MITKLFQELGTSLKKKDQNSRKQYKNKEKGTKLKKKVQNSRKKGTKLTKLQGGGQLTSFPLPPLVTAPGKANHAKIMKIVEN